MANGDDLPLDDLQAFLAVVSAGGFRAAARRSGRGASTLSEAVARLEGRLGTPLLIRTTRALGPTEAGRALAARLTPALAEARAALEAVAGDARTVRGPLRLNVPKAVMIDILPPLVDRFLARHPHVSVELVVEDSFVDAIAAGCHAGIRYGEALAQDVIAVPLGPARQEAALAAAPAYLARRGTPAHPDEIPAHDCLLIRFASGALAAWEFERGAEALRIVPPARLTVSAAAVEAGIGLALAGHGLIQMFGNWLAPQFDSGALVPVLREWWPDFDGPRLYFPNRAVAPPLRAFLDLVAETRAPDRAAAPRPSVPI